MTEFLDATLDYIKLNHTAVGSSNQRRQRHRLQGVAWAAGQHASMRVLRLVPLSLAMQAHAGYFPPWLEDVGRPVSRVSGQSVFSHWTPIASTSHRCPRPQPMTSSAVRATWNRKSSADRVMTMTNNSPVWPVTVVRSSPLHRTSSLAGGRHLQVH